MNWNDCTFKIVKTSSRSETERRRSRSVLYVQIVNKDFAKPVQELISDFRYNNPHTVYRKMVLPQAFKELGLPSDTVARWSQYAGCSCPCSPGFILPNVSPATNYWVDITVNAEKQLELAI